VTTFLGVELVALLIVFTVDTVRKRRSFLEERDSD